jgi:hypothetical protein
MSVSKEKFSIVVNYNVDDSSDGCPLTKIEVIEDDPLLVGGYVCINAVSSDTTIIPTLRLWQGVSNLGAPSLVDALNPEFTELVVFDGDSVVELNWPVISIESAVAAKGHIYKKINDDINLEYLSGESVPAHHGGGACVEIDSTSPVSGASYYGGLNVTATRASQYGQWIWEVSGSGVFSFFLKNAEGAVLHHFQVTIDSGESLEGDPELVTIKALNSVTDVPVENAEVFVNGELKGTTDSGGILSLGLLDPGIYSLKIVHPSYITTDTDEIENDSFVIGTVSS